MSKKEKAKAAKAERGGTKHAMAKATAMPSHSTDLDEQRILLISKALSDPTRMAMLRNIAKGAGRCSDMRGCLGVSAATLSHHLKELEGSGVITLEREGRFVSASLEKKLWKKYVAELKSLV